MLEQTLSARPTVSEIMGVELQDIFAAHMTPYLESHHLSHVQWKAARSIVDCRTAALGAHIDTCDNCGHTRISYNSCRNRHCPKCQTVAKEKWIEKQRQHLLDIPYFHVVFTVPAEFNPVFLSQQNALYALLFQAASETVLELCADRKYLGATPGMTAVLHTWGQNLQFHPHIHMIVTGGGLTKEGKWRNSKKHFFLPDRVLSSKRVTLPGSRCSGTNNSICVIQPGWGGGNYALFVLLPLYSFRL